MEEMLLAVYCKQFPYSCRKQEDDIFMVTGVSIFILPSDSLPPTKKKKRYICALDHSSNARGRYKDNCSCSTPPRKEIWQLMVDQAGAQRDPRSTQRLYSSHVLVNSSSLCLTVVAGIEVVQAERRTPWCFISFYPLQGACFHPSLHQG